MRSLPLVMLGALLFTASNGAAAERPNVLFIVSDDLNCRLGCYGAAEAKTPNIDRLAARGVRFDRAYCNYPVCNASRTSFLSGRYPEVTGVLGNSTDPRVRLGADFQFLPEYFRAQQYFTAGAGKIAHGRFSDAIKWDYFSEPAHGIGDDEDGSTKTVKKKGNKKSARSAESSLDVPFAWQATTHSDEEEPDGQTARRLLKYLSKQDKPFFVAAGFHKPHIPHIAPQKYFEMHEVSRMPTPPEPPVDGQRIPSMANPPKYHPELSADQRRAITQHYYAATSFMDAQVGVLLDELDRLKLWDSTIVLCMSDHGWHLGEHGGFYAKMSVMDESARAPLIVAAPGGARGAATGALVEYVDVFPTLVELCGLPQAPGLQGRSFASAVKNPQGSGKEAVYTVVMRGSKQTGRALHTPEFTYLEWPDGSQQLYNVATDPHEYRNLAGEPSYASLVAKLKTQLAQRRAEIEQDR